MYRELLMEFSGFGYTNTISISVDIYKCSEHRFCVATKPTTYVERGHRPL